METNETMAPDPAAGSASCDAPDAGACSAGESVRAKGAPDARGPAEDRANLQVEVSGAEESASMLRRPVTAEERAKILSLHHAEGWPVGTIAAQLGRHHDTVERVLGESGLAVTKQSTRTRLIDPFVPFLKETLAKYPRLRASRLWTMAKARGYAGSRSGFRAIVSRLRPRRAAEAYLRRVVLPGKRRR